MMRTAVLLLVLLGVVLAAPTLPTCCKDLDGNDLPVPCTCLTDDETLFDQEVLDGEYKYYHWVMTNWGSINVPDEDRPEMTVEVSPCHGDTHLYIQGPSLQANPFPTVESSLWNSSTEYSPNAITFSLTAAQYFITVFGNADSNFTMAVQIEGPQYDVHAFPTPGGNGTVVALPQTKEQLLLPGDPIGMDVTFFTAETDHGNEDTLEYRLYKLPVVTGEVCGEENVTSTEECILSSPCGVQRVMIPDSDWIALPPGVNTTIASESLEQNEETTFTVLVRNPATGNVAAYTGTRGTPTYERVGQAASDSTIIIIASAVGGVFVLLVGCIVFAKFRLNKAFQERRAKKQYKSIAPNAEAAGKSGGAVGTDESKGGRSF